MEKRDPQVRAELLTRLRAEQTRRDAHSLTPTERLEQSFELLELFDQDQGPTADEPPELLLRMIADLRALDR